MRLAHDLLSLEDESPEPSVEAAWDQEITRRMEDFRVGKTQDVPRKKAMASVRGRFPS